MGEEQPTSAQVEAPARDRTWVDVGLPVYNGAEGIERAVRSVLNQTYDRITILISDNASTDGTGAICKRLAAEDDRIVYMGNSVNLGATRNFNRVFVEGSSRYFKWMSHDDVLDPSAIEKAVDALEKRPDLAVVHWSERITDSDGNLLREYRPDQAFRIEGRTAGHRFRQMLNWSALGYAGDPIYGVIRRSALETTGLLSNKLNANFLLLEELALCGGIYQIPEVLATRTYNDVRTTAEAMLSWLDPNSSHRFPHVRLWWEHARIGIKGSKAPVEGLKTVGSLFGYAFREGLKGFAWDIKRFLLGGRR
ncbi:MAG: glycosyltransferase family 2 protein [Acidimicrobiia bacterium]|nr:glycosyltransferase family 2 protein [Acidimicrobiia bacterium]